MEEPEKKNKTQEDPSGISRRDVIKGLVTLPALGGVLLSAYQKRKHENILKSDLFNEIGLNTDLSPVRQPVSANRDQQIRVGIIGFGIRGEQLVRAAGFASESWMKTQMERAESSGNNIALETFMAQDDLNIIFNGVCDIFEIEADNAQKTVSDSGHQAKKYENWKDLVHAEDIDAVIIATPDHWHAPMAIEAARAGKHVYIEKPMTHKMQETYDLYDIVKKTGIVLQLGHQFRQTESYGKAKELIRKDVLGKITMIQTNTNRNSPNGAWQYDIHPEASERTIDWQQFLGNAPQVPFNKDHFFRWRKYWAYGTGLSGDLLTHDYDAINQILDLGIPKYVSASGGIYFFKDGREVPDVFNVLFEYPDRDLTFQYSATLANEYSRPNVIMGHDATMEVGNTLMVYPDRSSTRYEKMIGDGKIDLELPLFSYTSGAEGLDAITTATERYFASKGLLYTFRDGKRVDVTHLHIADWLDSIRTNSQPSCHIGYGFEEAVAAHMGTLSFKLGRKIEWDHERNTFANVSQEEVMQVLKG
jgi:predicted dehydrogenase